MKALLQFTLSVLLILAMRSQAHAQCANDNVQWLSSTVTCGAPAQTLTSCIYGGEYRLVNGIVVGNTYVFSTCGNTDFDTQITLYNDASGAFLAYNDDFCGAQSQVTWVASFSGSVRVLVDQYNCQSNSTCMTLTASCTGGGPPPTGPANDACANATPIACGGTATGSTTSATIDGPSGDCTGGSVAPDVWYTITGTGASITASLCGSSYDTQIDVYTGSCGALTNIGGCNDDFCATQSQMTWASTLGVVYRIRVHGFSGSTGAFTLAVTCATPLANDNCAGAIALPMIPSNGDCMNATLTTVGASGTSDPVCTGTEDDDVWHTFTTPAGATSILYTNTNASGNTDRVHQLYSGSSCGALTSIGCFDDESGSFTGLTGNTTYFLRTYTWSSGVTTTFNLCLRVPPPPLANDDCLGSISLPVNSGPTCAMATNGTTAGATQSLTSCAGTANDDVWYSFVATSTVHDVTVVGASSFDAVLNVRSGACNGTSLVCVDNTGSGGTEVANLTGLTIGNIYLVRVHHYFSSLSSTPTFTICVTTPVPPCSAPSTPMVNSVGTTSASLSWGAVSGATLYRYSSGSGFHTCGSGSLTTAGTNVNLTGLTPNTTYSFCVRTDACGGGAASSYVSTTFTTNPLPNDNCSGAINVTCGQTVTGSTVGATSDASMGACSLGSFGAPGSGTAIGGTPGNGVWYRLMGDGSQVTASLCNSSYDTKIHIYEGACGSLTCVASNDDNSAQCSPGSRSYVQFNTNPGTDYYILVSGFSSATGSFSLQLGCVCGAPLGFPWTTAEVGGVLGEAIDNVCGGSIDISSNGYSTATSDKMMLASLQVCGDATITVRVSNITNQGYAGITMRENLAPGSRHASLSTQLANRVFREARSFTNGPTQKQQLFRPGHSWLRIVRTGNTFLYYSSSNGSQWGFVGTSTIAMPNCLEIGMFTTGLTQASIATAVFTDLAIDLNQQNTIDDNPAQFKAEIPLNDELSIFPNPSSGEVNLRLGQDWIGQSMEITVFNGVGKVVMNENIDQINFDTHSFSLDRVASGIYFMQVKSENGMSKTERIVINK